MTTVRSPDLVFKINDKEIERMFALAPRRTFFHVRDALGGIFGSHRREFIQRTQAQFRRGGMRVTPLRSTKATPTGFAGLRSFFYRVFPQQKEPPPGQRPKLEDISAETFTSSKVALGLEKGGVFTPRTDRLIAIPIGVTLDRLGRPKSRWVTPTRFRKASERNQLVLIQKRGRAPVLYQVKGGRRTSSRRGTKRRRVLLPAYMLVPKVRRRPRLRYLRTWDELSSDRSRRLGRALERIVVDMKRGRES